MYIKRFGKWALCMDKHGVAITRDGNGQAQMFPGGIKFQSNLAAIHYDSHMRPIKSYDLGSGSVTNVGVMALANDWAWASLGSFGGVNTLKLANYHASGNSGAVSPANTDLILSSANAPFTASLGLQSLLVGSLSQKYQSQGIITYSAGSTITEWGLFTGPAFNGSALGSPLTSVSSNFAVATGTPYGASGPTSQGQQQNIIYMTGGTAVYALITNNTPTTLSFPAWINISSGTLGSAPGGTDSFTLYPVMFDHKSFNGIAVTSGQSIQFTYQLTIVSGG